MRVRIPDKLAFKRKEVINITSLDGKVIDFWEQEFGLIKPVVNSSEEKFYSKQDIENILRIKELLIVKRLSKDKVKEQLGSSKQGDLAAEDIPLPETKKTGRKKVTKKTSVNRDKSLKSIKTALNEILTLLDKNDKV